MIFIYKTKSKNPYYNLALEEFFFNYASDNSNSLFLYFWQNDNTVVIGKNQEACVECNMDFMKENNIKLLRRKTGGGAVFHDKNNLNFSFIVPQRQFDKKESMKIISSAIDNLGFKTELSGRNDVLIFGKKFSGNAYYNSASTSLHHGTILIDTNIYLLKNSLTPNIAKLSSNGVKSVSSRVLNLKEIKDIKIEDIEKSIQNEFVKTYKQDFSRFEIKNYRNEILKYYKKFKSKKWLFPNSFDFELVKEKKFPWGYCVIKKDKKGQYYVFSDSIDVEAIKIAQDILNGDNVSFKTEIVEDILNLIK